MKYADETEIEIIQKFINAGGSLTLSPAEYFDKNIPTKRHQKALSRLVKKGNILRGQSHGGHGHRSYITYHLRSQT